MPIISPSALFQAQARASQLRTDNAYNRAVKTTAPTSAIDAANIARTNTSRGGLAYPNSDFPVNHHMEMKWYEYKRPGPSVKGSLTYVNSIFLPLPENLIQAWSLQYENQDQGAAQAFLNVGDNQKNAENLARNLGNFLRGEKTDFDLKTSAQNLAEGTGDALKYRGARILQETALGGVITQLAGAIPNPHASVLFKGINLRTFDFQWKLSPRTQADSSLLGTIIQLLKFYALPSKPEGSVFLKYPNMCEIIVKGFNDGQIKYKKAMLENFSVNYTPDGGANMYNDGNSVTVLLSTSFKEIEYFTRENAYE